MHYRGFSSPGAAFFFFFRWNFEEGTVFETFTFFEHGQAKLLGGGMAAAEPVGARSTLTHPAGKQLDSWGSWNFLCFIQYLNIIYSYIFYMKSIVFKWQSCLKFKGLKLSNNSFIHMYVLDPELGSLVLYSIFYSLNIAASNKIDLFWNLTCKNNCGVICIILEIALLHSAA